MHTDPGHSQSSRDERSASEPSGQERQIQQLIEDADRKLALMREMHDRTRAESAELKLQREDVERRMGELAEARRALETERSALEHSRADIESQHANLQQRSEALEQVSSDIDSRALDLQLREQDLEERILQVDTQASELLKAHQELANEREQHQKGADSLRADLQREREEILGERARLDADLESLIRDREAFENGRDEKIAELTARLEANDARSEELQRAESQLREQAESIGRLESEIAAHKESDEARVIELEALRKAAEDAREALAQAERDAQEREAEMEQLARVLDTQAADASEQIKTQTQQIIDLEASRGRLEDEIAQLRSALDSTDQSADEQIAALREALQVAGDQITQHARERDSARRDAGDLKSELNELRTRAEKDAIGVARLREQVTAKEAELEKTRASLEATIADLREQLEAATDGVARIGAERDSLRKQIESFSGSDAEGHEQLLRELDALRASLASVEDKASKTRKIADDRQQLADSLTEKIGELTRENKSLAERIDELSMPAGAATVRVVDPPPGPARDAVWVARRRKRLRRSRELIARQSAKVRKASALLNERFEQCEAMLAHRATVVEAHRAVEELGEKLKRRKAAMRSGWLAVAAVVAITALSGLSWMSASIFVPAEHAGTIRIAAQATRPLAQAEMDEWRSYHTSLLRDPRFAEKAAERFDQRGVPGLTSPTAVQQRFERDLAILQEPDAAITLEWRGAGRGAVVRELDTVARTLVSEANAARMRRAVGVSAQVEGDVDPGDPIDNQRVIVAAAGILGGSALLLIFVWASYRRLVSQRGDLERPVVLDEVLEAEWAGATPQSDERRAA